LGDPAPDLLAADAQADHDDVVCGILGSDDAFLSRTATGSRLRRLCDPGFGKTARVTRLGRLLLIVVGALVVLLVVADIAGRVVAQDMVASRLEDSLDLSEKPSVSLHGFPFLLHAAEGSFPSATASADSLTAQGVTIRSVALTLDDLRFSPGDLLGGRHTTVRAASGQGTATMTGAGMTDALGAQGVDLTVEIADGKVRVRSSSFPVSIEARISLSGRTLTLRSADTRIPASFSVRLPEFVDGLQFTDIHLQGSEAVLAFDLNHPSFAVGG
jgi:hypothetical protein